MKPFDIEKTPRLKPGFQIPEHYFDGFEDRVLSKLETTEPKVVPLWSRYRIAVIAAAAVLVLAVLIPLFNRATQPSQLDDATIENYLAYESNMTQFDLLTVLEPADIENLDADINIEDEAIEDFLLTNDIEHSITE